MSKVPLKKEEAEELAKLQMLVPAVRNFEHEESAEHSERSMNLDDTQSLGLPAHNPEPLSNNVTCQASSQLQRQSGFDWTGAIDTSGQKYTPAQFGQLEQNTSLPQNHTPAQPTSLGQSDSLRLGRQQNPSLVRHTPQHAPTQGQTAFQLEQSSGPSQSGQPPKQPSKTKPLTAKERYDLYDAMSNDQLRKLKVILERDIASERKKEEELKAELARQKDRKRLMPAYAKLLQSFVDDPISQEDIDMMQQQLVHIHEFKEHLKDAMSVFLVGTTMTDDDDDNGTTNNSGDAMEVDTSSKEQAGDTVANGDEEEDLYDDPYVYFDE